MSECIVGPHLKWAGRKRRVPSKWMRTYFAEYVGALYPGEHVHHTCRNPWCIEPTHLTALSAAEHRAQHAANPDVRKRPFPILH